MSIEAMPPELRALALEVLTDRQIAAVELYERGCSQRTIAAALGISRETVRDRLDSAEQRLTRAMRERGAASLSATVAGVASGAPRALRRSGGPC